MIDPFGTTLSWILIVGASAYIAYHLTRVIRSRRLEIRNAAAIIFGTGILILELPRRVYPNLSAEGLDALSWFGVVTIAVSIALEIWGRRIARNTRVAN